MNSLSHLLTSRSSRSSRVSSTQQKAYVTYTLSSLSSTSVNNAENFSSNEAQFYVSLSSQPATITLLECHTLLSAGGTTGFRTWEAALHLGDYLCTNPALVSGKRIIE